MKPFIRRSKIGTKRHFLIYILAICICSNKGHSQVKFRSFVERTKSETRELSEGKPRATYLGQILTPATQLKTAKNFGGEAPSITPALRVKPESAPITVESLLGRDSIEASNPTDGTTVTPGNGQPGFEEVSRRTMNNRVESEKPSTPVSSGKATHSH